MIASFGRFTCSSNSPYNSLTSLTGNGRPIGFGMRACSAAARSMHRERLGVPPLREQIERFHLTQHDLGLLAQFRRLRRRRRLAEFVDHRRARARHRRD